MENPGWVNRCLDFIGGCVDAVFLFPPRLMRPFKPVRKVSRNDYEKEVLFYFEEGYAKDPKRFFTLDDACPDYRVIEEKPYKDGRFQVIAYESGYPVKNPLIEDPFNGLTANKTGYLVRWIHPEPTGKTLMCLHGYMLGEPNQAHRMFHMEKLYDLGLDLALFIAPLHWRRSAPGLLRRGWFMRVDHVGFTCEAMGQAMFDLNHCVSILKANDAGRIGLIGASMGGYFSALYSSLRDRHDFAAMMVPSVNFSRPYGPAFARHPFETDPVLEEKIARVWELHAPLHLSPTLSPDKMLIVASRGDRLCSFEHIKTFQKKWGVNRHYYMTGGHWLVFNESIRGKAWYGFLSEMGFI